MSYGEWQSHPNGKRYRVTEEKGQCRYIWEEPIESDELVISRSPASMMTEASSTSTQEDELLFDSSYSKHFASASPESTLAANTNNQTAMKRAPGEYLGYYIGTSPPLRNSDAADTNSNVATERAPREYLGYYIGSSPMQNSAAAETLTTSVSAARGIRQDPQAQSGPHLLTSNSPSPFLLNRVYDSHETVQRATADSLKQDEQRNRAEVGRDPPYPKKTSQGRARGEYLRNLPFPMTTQELKLQHQRALHDAFFSQYQYLQMQEQELRLQLQLQELSQGRLATSSLYPHVPFPSHPASENDHDNHQESSINGNHSLSQDEDDHEISSLLHWPVLDDLSDRKAALKSHLVQTGSSRMRRSNSNETQATDLSEDLAKLRTEVRNWVEVHVKANSNTVKKKIESLIDSGVCVDYNIVSESLCTALQAPIDKSAIPELYGADERVPLTVIGWTKLSFWHGSSDSPLKCARGKFVVIRNVYPEILFTMATALKHNLSECAQPWPTGSAPRVIAPVFKRRSKTEKKTGDDEVQRISTKNKVDSELEQLDSRIARSRKHIKELEELDKTASLSSSQNKDLAKSMEVVEGWREDRKKLQQQLDNL